MAVPTNPMTAPTAHAANPKRIPINVRWARAIDSSNMSDTANARPALIHHAENPWEA